MAVPGQLGPTRSSLYAVEVVTNKQGSYVNLFIDRVPHNSLGPYPEPLTIAEAFTLAATYFRMETQQ